IALIPMLGWGQTVLTGRHRKVFTASGSITVKGTPVCGYVGYGTAQSASYTAAQTGDELFLEIWNTGTGYTFSSVAYNSASASSIIAPVSGNNYSAIF